MRARDVLQRVALGVLVFAVVVAGGVAAAGGDRAETPSVESLQVEAYGEDTVAAVPDEAGRVEVSANASGAVVLIDTSHGNSLDRDQLTPIVTALTRNGAEVRFMPSEDQRRSMRGEASPFNASLREADAFVSIAPQRAYTQSEIDALDAFSEAGGRVLLATEPARMQVALLILGPRPSQESTPMPMAPLASRFGVSLGNGYLYHMQEYDTNYRNVYATPTGDGELVAGVDRLVLHESTPVRGPSVVVRSIEGTELSETRKTDRFGVVARSGNVTAIGDTSVLGQDYLRRADNEVFVGNLLDFLVSGDKDPENAPAPPAENETQPRPPRAAV